MGKANQKVMVTASRWHGGWDLILDDDNATSACNLKDAQKQVRDYLDTIEPHVDHSETEIDIVVNLDGLEKDISRAKNAIVKAAEYQKNASIEIRKVAKSLKGEGVTAEDIGFLLNVTRGRVYQLLSSTE